VEHPLIRSLWILHSGSFIETLAQIGGIINGVKNASVTSVRMRVYLFRSDADVHFHVTDMTVSIFKQLEGEAHAPDMLSYAYALSYIAHHEH
jgi:hypothetical protein